jgi:hypothetical protein
MDLGTISIAIRAIIFKKIVATGLGTTNIEIGVIILKRMNRLRLA